MKFHLTTPGNSQREKIQYEVIIEDSTFVTTAYIPELALSNACWRYVEENDEDVALIKWRVREGKLYSNVGEG